MPSAPSPRPVRLAGVLVAAQGLVGVAVAVALVVRSLGGPERIGPVLGEAGYFAVLGAGVAAAGVGLLRSRRWARTPSLLVQILLLGVAWYATGPSARPEYGVPVGLLCLLVIGLLLSSRSRAWAVGEWRRRPGHATPDR